MKNIFLVLLLFLIPVSAFSAVEETNPYKVMAKSNSDIHELYSRLISNFRRNVQFTSYLRTRCTLFEADRQRAIGVLYPYPNSYEAGYNEKYPKYISDYSVEVNNAEYDYLINITKEFCTHNEYKLRKKSPNACRADVLNEIFRITE